MTEEITLQFYGAAADYMAYEGLEALCDSGAGTGKSFCLLTKAYLTATQNPNSRQIFLRQTRKSLNDSILPMWRDKVLTKGHPAISPTATIPYQDNYVFPNGSVIVIGGLEDPDRILSAEYDRIYVFQAEETGIESWEKLISRLRAGNTPYHQITADVNPASRFHWLNRRFPPEVPARKGLERFCFRHQDNPTLFDHEKAEWHDWGRTYVQDILGSLTGIRKERLLYHRWVAEEGVIFEDYDPQIHLLTAELEHDEHSRWMLHIKGQHDPVQLAYFTAGVDWGWDPDPGVISVWGYDSPRWHPTIRRFRVAEIYRTHWQREEWADAAVDLWARFDLRFLFCDRSNPEAINLFNIRIGARMGRDMPAIATKYHVIGGGHNREILNGIDTMREGLRNPLTGHVRTYFVRDALEGGQDPRLVKAGRPTCTEQEIHEWVYLKNEEQKPNKEAPDPKCDEHGIDCWRMDEVSNFVLGYGKRKRNVSEWQRGTYGEAWANQLKRKRDALPKFVRRRLKHMPLPSQLQGPE